MPETLPKGKAPFAFPFAAAITNREACATASEKPEIQAVRKYLEVGFDPVFNFHKEPKGGFYEGARLVAIIPDGRPEDRRALGHKPAS